MRTVTEEELHEIIQLRGDVNNVVFNLGQISLEINKIEQMLYEAKVSQSQYISTYSILEERNKRLTGNLVSQYGQGSIDLETGEIN